MEISYQRSFNESYMIVEGDMTAAGYEKQMLRKNQIQSLLTFYTMEANGKLQFWYEITGKESLRDYLEQKPFDMQILDEIITYLAIAYDEINSYLLLQEHIFLRPETVYVERSNSKTKLKLCYCPMQQTAFSLQFREMIEFILTIVDHKEELLTDVCYNMYEKSLLEDYNISNIAECIETVMVKTNEIEENPKRIDKEQTEIYVEQVDLTKENVAIEQMEESSEEFGDWIRVRLTEKLKKLKDVWQDRVDIRKTKLRCHDKEQFDVVMEPLPKEFLPTQLLKEESSHCIGKLQYTGELQEEDYIIKQEVFHIGSRDENNDANLKSEAVSRHHAKITRRGECFYIEDLNSTNGTYLNGELLNYRQQLRLSVNDKLMFANVSYVFV